MISIRKGERQEYLDGLRGIAALIVVAHHFCFAFLPGLFANHGVGPLWISDTPVAIVYNGRFAVILFFVLSGFVVSNSAQRSRSLVLTSLMRYLRLALPAALSVVVAWAMLRLFPSEATKVNSVAESEWLGFTLQGDIPPLTQAIYHGLVGIFIDGTSLFNNVLWTMKIELIGSLAIYVMYSFIPVPAARIGVIIFVGIVLTPLHYGIYEGFVAGAMLREMWAAGHLRPVSPAILLSVGILIGSLGDGFHERYHLPHVPRSLMLGEASGLLYPVAATCIVYACLTSPPIKLFLAHYLPRFLGRISFSLYLYHVPFVYTIFCFIYIHALNGEKNNIALLFAAYIPFSISVATMATILVDEPIVRSIARVKNFRSSSRTAMLANAVNETPNSV